MPLFRDKQSTAKAYFNVRSTEIQWRGIQRDAIMLFALVLCGSLASVSGSLAGLIAPIPLLFLAANWLRHDRRIGSAAAYLRDIVEPALEGKLEGFEYYLARTEPKRTHGNRRSLIAVMNRLYFPTLQAGMVGLGLYRYNFAARHDFSTTVVVLVAAGVGLSIALFTLLKVKHERSQ